MKNNLENHWLHLVAIFCNFSLATASAEKSIPNFHFNLLQVKKQQQKTTIKKISPHLLQEQCSKYSEKKVTSFSVYYTLGSWDGGKLDNLGQWQNMDEEPQLSQPQGCPSENQHDWGNFSHWVSLCQITSRLPVAFWMKWNWIKWNGIFPLHNSEEGGILLQTPP